MHDSCVLKGCALAAQVVEEGSWAEAVGSALAKLGVRVLDSARLPASALGAAGRRLVRPATGGGVLAAIGAAAGGDLGRIGRTFVASGVTAAEREQLRSFLLQVRHRSLLLSLSVRALAVPLSQPFQLHDVA